MPLARISLPLSRYFSLLFIASGRSSGLHPISSYSCCMHVRAGRPAFTWPYAGVHRSTSFVSSSFLLQQCPACLVRLTWIVFVMGGRWAYSWCLVGCCCQDIVIDRKTALFCQNSSPWQDMRDAWSWDRNLTEFMPGGYSTVQPPPNSTSAKGFLWLCITFVYIYIPNSYWGPN